MSENDRHPVGNIYTLAEAAAHLRLTNRGVAWLADPLAWSLRLSEGTGKRRQGS